MPDLIEERVRGLGLTLPGPHLPPEPMRGAIAHGPVARTSGQLPRSIDGKIVHPGIVGDGVTVEQASVAARWCVLNALSVLRDQLGSLDRIDRVLHLLGFVACAPGFTGQPGVLDGASILLAELFGDSGHHTRSAVGVAGLPRGACVEIELTVSLRD